MRDLSDEPPHVAENRARRNEAIERVGRWLYGETWIGELDKQEWTRGKISDELPGDPKQAALIARARYRSQASDEQYGLVFRWLQGTCAIDCTPTGFDAAKFEAFWTANFPPVATDKDARLSAIKLRWQEGKRPGNGGTCTWKEFTALICADCGGAIYDERTIRRDVKNLFGA